MVFGDKPNISMRGEVTTYIDKEHRNVTKNGIVLHQVYNRRRGHWENLEKIIEDEHGNWIKSKPW